MSIQFRDSRFKRFTSACKHGFPAVAVSGVDSWRNRTLMLPAETELSKAMNGTMIQAKLPSGFDPSSIASDIGPLAHGFTDLVDYLVNASIGTVDLVDHHDDG